MVTLIFLTFKSDVAPGAHPLATDKIVYPVENEMLFDFCLVASGEFLTSPGLRVGTTFVLAQKKDTRITPFETPSTPVVIPGPQDASAFDDAAKAYLCDTVDPARVKEVLEAQQAGKLKLHLTIRIWWKKFFKEMLKFLTRIDGDTFNLARPDSTADVENSFTRVVTKKNKIDFTFADDQVEFKHIPCELKSRVSDDQKFQNLEVSMRLDQLPAADHKNVATTLIAADWAKLYQHKAQFVDGKDKLRPSPWYLSDQPPTGEERALQTRESNIARYLFTHASLKRGQTIIDEIIRNATAVMAKPVLEVVQQVRDDIDARMITANHWGDLRENPKTEKFQRALSDLFGEIHQNHWYASPVRYLRVMSGQNIEVGSSAVSASEQVKLLALQDKGGMLREEDKWVQWVLQFGTGHCGEHSGVSYFVIKKLMDAGNEAKFVCAVSTGNANVDHAFVVGGFQVGEVITTKNKKAFSPGGIGKSVNLWDLELQLIIHKGQAGWVLDPYLDSSVQPKTLKDLLARLNNPQIRGELATKFLRFREQHKPNKDILVTDKPDGVPGV